MSEEYDCGCLSDYGGGNVGWWQDYIRSEVRRANDFNASAIESLESELADLKEENERLKAEKVQINGKLAGSRLAVSRLEARVAELEKVVEKCRQAYFAPPLDAAPRTLDDYRRTCDDLLAALKGANQ